MIHDVIDRAVKPLEGTIHQLENDIEGHNETNITEIQQLKDRLTL